MSLEKIKKEAFKKPPFFISYLITDPIEFGNTPTKLKQALTNSLQKYCVDIVCFRDKTSQNKEELAKVCLDVAKKFGIDKVLINSDIELCHKLGFDGIHLNSTQFSKLEELEQSSLYTMISCHTQEEIAIAKNYKTDAVTYSPIFFKEHKGKPKGIKNLEEIVTKYQDENFSIIALGGIVTNENVQQIVKTQAKGFASIRYFKV
ncbi:MAG: thiamine phosphate synthase [Arcobacteraceae bacterium]